MPKGKLLKASNEFKYHARFNADNFASIKRAVERYWMSRDLDFF